jgi:hypothetical protein
VVSESCGTPKGVPFSARLAFRPIASFSFGTVNHVPIHFRDAAHVHGLHVDIEQIVDQIYSECFSRRIHSPM